MTDVDKSEIYTVLLQNQFGCPSKKVEGVHLAFATASFSTFVLILFSTKKCWKLDADNLVCLQKKPITWHILHIYFWMDLFTPPEMFWPNVTKFDFVVQFDLLHVLPPTYQGRIGLEPACQVGQLLIWRACETWWDHWLSDPSVNMNQGWVDIATIPINGH